MRWGISDDLCDRQNRAKRPKFRLGVHKDNFQHAKKILDGIEGGGQYLSIAVDDTKLLAKLRPTTSKARAGSSWEDPESLFRSRRNLTFVSYWRETASLPVPR
jgi:hypothetical protein